MTKDSQHLIAEEAVQINATASRVWDVLVRPEYIRQWDDVPEDFEASSLVMGSVLEWAGSARLTVTLCEPQSHLRLAYHSPNWSSPVDGIAYDYELQESSGGSRLIVRVGNWAKAPDGRAQDYYHASIEFVQAAVVKIKQLAER